MDAALVLSRLVLATVFAVAGAAKLADMAGSRAAVAGFGVPERLAVPLGTLLPFAELATAALLLAAATARAGGVAALALLALFGVGIAASMARGKAPDCHCFGQLHSEPAGPRTLARNVVLAGVAGFVAFAGADAGPGIVEEIGSLDAGAAAAIASGLALVLLVAGGVAGLLSLLRQNGRLLLRIEALEAALKARGIPIPAVSAPGAEGPPVGSTAPDFELPGLDGGVVTLRSLLSAGRPALLVFTSPGCAPCDELMPQVATWQRELAAGLTVAVIGGGAHDESREKVEEHGLANVLIEEGRDVANRYGARATPSAVMVGADGRLASAVAAGGAAISALVERGDGVPSGEPEVVRVRPAAAVGSQVPEPDAAARDLDGAEVSIRDALGGRERLLLFWDTHCGYCRRMLADLREWEREAGERAATLLVISGGDAEENRAQGISAPILLDDAFAIGQSLGVRGTPSAVRVDAQGRVASDVAVGADAVLALARAPSP